MPFRKPSILTPEGESGKWDRVQGRHVFVPTAEQEAEPVGEGEIERWEHPTPAYKYDSIEDNENVRNIHADGAKESETYIGDAPKKDKLQSEGKNKISEVRLEDTIKYYLNGVEGKGYVIAMTNDFFTVRKDTGGYQDIHVSDVFFVDSILNNKSWDNMDVQERVELMHKTRCPLSFVVRRWEDLPQDIQNVLKSNFEHGEYGGIPNQTPFDASEDYEATPIKDDKTNFKYEEVKPDEIDGKVPKFVEHPEIKISKDGKSTSPMMAGVKAEDEVEKTEDEVEKEGVSMGTSDAGSFNAVHNERKKGLPKEYSSWGITYNKTTLDNP